MKYSLFILSFFIFITTSYSQGSISSSTLGSNGTSKTVSSNNKTYYVSQSINQTSVIGTFSKKGYTIRQGFQQPQDQFEPIINIDLQATVFPNPFNQSVFISFPNPITENINITVTDITGRSFKSMKFSASQKIELPLEIYSSGIYILKVTTKNKLFITKLLKK